MKIFQYYFEALNKTLINYAITGRTENYPVEIHSDIDIIIPSAQFVEFWKFMHQVSDKGIELIQVISHESIAHYCVITLGTENNYEILKPDVCSDYYRKAVLFLKADFLLENRVYNAKGFYQLAPEKEFIYYLLKKIDKGSIDAEQFNHLKEQYNRCKDLCLTLSLEFFNKNNVATIANSFENNNLKTFQANLSALKKDLHSSLKFSLKDYIAKAKNRLQRIIQPTGLVVAFMGPDGCGKTTVIEGVKTDLTEIFRQNKHYHLFPKETKNTAPTTAPHNQIQRKFIGSLLKLLYFLGLYVYGYWSKIYPQKIKSTLIIFDRYYHDLLVDKKRYRNGTSDFWINLIGIFIPKPDIWILLDAAAEVIQKRKKEVSFEESERQVKAYKKLFSELDNAYVVNANQSPERVIFDTEKIIIDYLKERTTKRYKRI